MLEKTQSIFRNVSRNSDILLAVMVVSVISLLIIPVPKIVLDLLLAINLTLSVSLLMISLYIPGVLALSTFPSLLLFTTLFRLSLNITTTRMILLDADAGQIIHTFGNFVVQGNFVVGAVIFLIILLVQFLVITKGAERVAEVAARFTLDAMPGKQMSIDADMRAGLMDSKQGKEQRQKIELENQIYGAMDGAMKFVKGDAIAGLIITAINIIAGLLIGILQRDMNFSGALETYSILTIGDGLVSSIPSLLISITAGVVVTRVSSVKENPLGSDIFFQMTAQPKALILGACLSFLLSAVPGFPKVPFWALGTGILAYAIFIMKFGSDEDEKQLNNTILDEDDESSSKEFTVIPILLRLPSNVFKSDLTQSIKLETDLMLRKLKSDMGIPLPDVKIINTKDEGTEYGVCLDEVIISSGPIELEKLLLRESESNLNDLEIPYKKGADFLPHLPTLWAEKDIIETLDQNHLDYMKAETWIAFHMRHVIISNMKEFMGFQETRAVLEWAREKFPDLVMEVERLLPLPRIIEIFQRLIEEEISLRYIRKILECITEYGSNEKDPVVLSDHIRVALGRMITHKYTTDEGTLPIFLIDHEIESLIRQSIKKTSQGTYLTVNPDESKKIIEAVESEVSQENQQNQLVIVTAMDIRRFIRKIIETNFPQVKVLAHQEIVSDVQVIPLGHIKF